MASAQPEAIRRIDNSLASSSKTADKDNEDTSTVSKCKKTNSIQNKRKMTNRGCYNLRKTNADEIEFSDFTNIATFCHIFLLPSVDLLKWLTRQSLISAKMFCHQCNQYCELKTCDKSQLNFIWRCSENHEYSVLKSSFLENCTMHCRDAFLFIRCYLLGLPLSMCAREAGYRIETAIVFSNFIKRFFAKIVETLIDHVKFSGSVEISEVAINDEGKKDESKDKSNAHLIFGLLEKESNKILLFQPKDLQPATLIPLIKKHVDKKATIYSDTWAKQLHLESCGYKCLLKKEYYKAQKKGKAKPKVDDDSSCFIPKDNAWVYMRSYLKSRLKCDGASLENHLSEIMWRKLHQADNIFDCFFSQIRSIYSFDSAPKPSSDVKSESPNLEGNNVSESSKPSKSSDKQTNIICEPSVFVNLEPDLGDYNENNVVVITDTENCHRERLSETADIEIFIKKEVSNGNVAVVSAFSVPDIFESGNHEPSSFTEDSKLQSQEESHTSRKRIANKDDITDDKDQPCKNLKKY